MYWWTPTLLLFIRLWHVFVTAVLIVAYYNGLGAFQFNPTAGPLHIVSPAPLSYDEKLWLAANLAVPVAQLSLLACMWRLWFRARLTTQSEDGEADNKVQLATLIGLLPCWGLLRPTHLLYSTVRKTALSPVRLAAVTVPSLVFLTFIFGLLLWSGVRALRLVTLASPLLGVDALAFICAMKTADFSSSWEFASRTTPTILSGILVKPRFRLASTLLFSATVMSSTVWYAFVILPLLSAVMVLRFLLVRHTTEYVVDPIPLPPSPVIPANRFCQHDHGQNEVAYRP
ncbi:hypothetical protein ColLi_13465 [Colletotrichum liriopes]|uniref:Uncharacterized protein n=1 Tax=Colletotrichum liriopes TaxID=708192 RepID=A0AA37LZJ2_9PEZI|nr:hypothetical protein ColLi_13465 [Colletotrichum liriopes]